MWEGITSSRSKYRESGALRNRQSEGEALRELRVSILSLLMFTPTHPPHRFFLDLSPQVGVAPRMSPTKGDMSFGQIQ